LDFGETAARGGLFFGSRKARFFRGNVSTIGHPQFCEMKPRLLANTQQR
jgi:hypothetical protein